MLSYAHGATDQPLLGETIGDNFERTAARVPDSPALISCHQGLRYTYAELNEVIDRLASSMHRAGLSKGDRVGVWGPNRAEWVLTQYATAKLGVILVNINPAYRTNELEYALGQSGCRWLIAAPELKGSSFVDMVAEVRPNLPDLERAVFFGSDEWESLADGEVDHDVLRTIGEDLDFDDPINIQYTSGTTGFPKGATLSHHNILNNGYFVAALLDYTELDKVCIPVPLYHCFGMVMGNLGATNHGACMVYPADTFDPRATLEACASEGCTSLYGVPTMFIAQLDHPDFKSFDLSSLRTGIMAGSPCPIEVMKRVSSDMGIEQMAIAFGMTETSPVTTQVRIDDTLENRCSTVGLVMPHTEIKIVDPTTGRIQPRGEPGEFLARGYPVMRGYWNDPDRTAEAIDSSRWMHTGDLATMDERGPHPHRRANQGHDHPRRRERLPARGRGVPVHPSRRRRRPGDRRPRRALWRAADGMGRVPSRIDRHRGRVARLLPGQDRPLQGSPLHQVRRLVPLDGHGQGSEVPHARDRDRGAGPGAGRRDLHGLARLLDSVPYRGSRRRAVLASAGAVAAAGSGLHASHGDRCSQRGA